MRGFFASLDLVFILVPALLQALSDRHHRGLHDHIAATFVIEDDEASKPLQRILQELT
jgi:hypothetical protein